MYCNNLMKNWLIELGDITNIIGNCKSKKYIKKCYTENRDDYYRLKKGFAFGKKEIKLKGEDLSHYEHEGNEMYVSQEKPVVEVLRYALGVAFDLRTQMLDEFSEREFDIVVSIDLGDEDVEPSITIWFYAVRDGYCVIPQKEIELYTNPVLVSNTKEEFSL